MKTKKEHVLDFFVNLPASENEQFNQAFDLYSKSTNCNPTQVRFLNKSGFNKGTLQTVLYELKKIHNITDRDIKKGKVVDSISPIRIAFQKLSESAQKAFLNCFKFIDVAAGLELTESVEKYASELVAGVNEVLEENSFFKSEVEKMDKDDLLKEFALEIQSVELPIEIKEELIRLKNLEKTSTEGTTVEEIKKQLVTVFENAPSEVKAEIKFRDEFPFINDPELPSELKELVTDKFSHYHAFAGAHAALSSQLVPREGKTEHELAELTNAEVFELAKKAVENFEMDQLIRDEFVYYKENNKVLGVHPIFKKRKLQESVDKMTIAEASRRSSNLENYIRRDGKKATEAKTPEDKANYENKVEAWTLELALINIKLGVGAGK